MRNALLNPMTQLDTYGPDRCAAMSQAEAVAWCRRFARSRYENFSVLTSLVPRDRRDAFAALYAFCRWADDLGDEVGDRTRATELLGWWRDELKRCYDGAPRHPVFIALAPIIDQFDLPIRLFDDLIRAFEQDQVKARYQTWAEVLEYCRLSADPVGRLVLMILDQSREDRLFMASDRICTALQLTNHWQDMRRDLIERNRIYTPAELIPIERFEERFLMSAKQGYAVDRSFLPESRDLVRRLVEKTWPLYEEGEQLLTMVTPEARRIIWLFLAGGQYVLRRIELWNYETVLHRPALSSLSRAFLVGRAMLMRNGSACSAEASA